MAVLVTFFSYFAKDSVLNNFKLFSMMYQFLAMKVVHRGRDEELYTI